MGGIVKDEYGDMKDIVIVASEFNKVLERLQSALDDPGVYKMDEIGKKTWAYNLSDIPYFTGYLIAYPFVWFTFWLWMGVLQAKEEIWD